MPCNGKNHRRDCNCNFRGGHPKISTPRPIGRWRVKSFSRISESTNAICPKCRAKVFYFRNKNGGGAYYDRIGRPWPLHPCMDPARNYHPFDKNGKPKLTLKPSFIEEFGMIPIEIRNIEYNTIGFIIHLCTLFDSKIVRIGSTDKRKINKNYPSYIKYVPDKNNIAELDIFLEDDDHPTTIDVFVDCNNEFELRIRSSS